MRFVFAAPTPAAVGGLPAALKKAGHEVAVLLPFDATAAKVAKSTRVRFAVRVGAQTVITSIHQASTPQRVPCYLAKADAAPAPNSAVEGIWFSQAVVELARRLTPTPDALILTDWQSGLAPAYSHAMDLPFRFVQWLDAATGEGSFPAEDFALTGLGGDAFTPAGVEFHGRLHFLKSALQHSQRILASGSLSFTARVRESGLLGELIAAQAGKIRTLPLPLAGEEWNPGTDPKLAQKFRPSAPAGKLACRAALLAGLALKPDPRGAVLLLDRGLTHAALDPLIDRLLAQDVRLVVTRAAAIEQPALEIAARRNPGQIAFQSDARAPGSGTFAGVDAILLPQSLSAAAVEAIDCAQRYGVLPVVADQPGLAGLCTDLRPLTGTGDAIICHRGDAEGWWDALGVRLQALLSDSTAREAAIQRAMERAASRSWTAAASEFPAAVLG